jgi:sialidase-1
MTTTTAEAVLPHTIISRGVAAGSYQAFPDSCRLRNGDILVAFYAGYTHISYPNDEYPTGGKICMVRSQDEGRTWSEPAILFDDEFDNRDPHLAQLSDGTIICSFFSLRRNEAMEYGYEALGVQITRSYDGGYTWETTGEHIEMSDGMWVCAAPVRELSDGTCLLPIYQHLGAVGWGGVVRSTDKGRTWSTEVTIGKEANILMPAETDIIQLKDGTLYAALRADQEVGIQMQYAVSDDLGVTWSPVHDIGFFGHSPYFSRLSNGDIILSYRGFHKSGDVAGYTALHRSRDEGQTWEGAFTVDACPGAYPSTVELDDGSILIVYYEEGEGSGIRAARFRLADETTLIPVQD